MSDAGATYGFGPESAQIMVLTRTAGPAARLGHNLELALEDWRATLDLGAGSSASKLSFKGDGASLRIAASGAGVRSASESDLRLIKKAIDEKVLKRSTVRFHSTSVSADDERARVRVAGTLTLLGTARPLQFELKLDPGGSFSGEAAFKQSDWGIKPYAVMRGALKVADEVTVTVSGRLPEPA